MLDKDLFWSLPGPSLFVTKVTETAMSTGMVAVVAPSYRPPGMAEAIIEALEASGVLPVHRVTTRAAGSAVAQVGLAAGLSATTMRSVTGFFDLPELRGCAFEIGGLRTADWSNWMPFFRSFASERRRRKDGMLLPVLVVFVPPDLPSADLDRLFPGAVMAWRERVSSFDIRTYVAGLMGRSPADDLLQRSATEVAIGLAGYDPILADVLCRAAPEAAIDPWEMLHEQYAAYADLHPHWSNGLVDNVDGQPFVHTAALVAAGDRYAFNVRRWRAVSGPVMDFNAMVCRHFADRYAAALESHLPFTAPTAFTPKVIHHRYGLENRHLRGCLEGVLSGDDDQFLRAAARARNDVAHNEVPNASLIRRLAAAWPAYAVADPPGARGWWWPRCRQRLVVLVGPSGAGKSTHAAQNYPAEEIVSTDAIRLEMYGSLEVSGSQEAIFATAEERLIDRLSKGENAVFDATNIQQRHRLRAVDLVPEDMEVQYVVIDRPIEVKRAHGGWRNQRPGLIDGHSDMFRSSLANILAGDGRRNVKVFDIREATARTAA